MESVKLLLSNPVAPVKSLESPLVSGESAKSTKGPAFSEAFEKALGEVDGLQKTADKQVESLVLGTGEVTTHEAMISLEKADTAFQLMNQVRTKIIRAYEEILRTQI